MNRLSLILLLTLFFACKGQEENDKNKLSFYSKQYDFFYTKSTDAIRMKNPKEFKINYDSTRIYIDKLLQNNPNSISLMTQKLGLLKLNNDFKDMITVYNKMIVNDSLNTQQKQNYKFGRFYCMVLEDSASYKNQTSEYYQDVNRNEKKISELLDNPNVYTDQPEIYKRMKLSYYFDGREITLKKFKPISNKIPFKFKYDLIKDRQKSPIEFLKDGMDFPVQSLE